MKGEEGTIKKGRKREQLLLYDQKFRADDNAAAAAAQRHKYIAPPSLIYCIRQIHYYYTIC